MSHKFLFAFLVFALVFTACTKENIDVTETEIPEIPVDTVLCNLTLDLFELTAGDSTAIMTEVGGGSMPYSYLWSDGSINPELFVTQTDTFSVTVTDANGCTIADDYFYQNDNSPCAGFFTEIDVASDTINGNGFILNAFPTGGTPPFAYSWSQGAATQILFEVQPGIYAVTVNDAEGCETEDEVTIE